MSQCPRVPRRSCCSRCSRAEPTSWPHSVRAPHCKPTIGCRSSSPRPGPCTRRPKAMRAPARARCGRCLPAVVAERMQSAGAADWTARGHAALQAKAFGMAHESFRRTLALDSRSADALRGSSDAAAAAHTLPQETEWLKTTGRSRARQRAQSAWSCLMSLRRLATPRKRSPPPGKPRASIRRARSHWSSWRRYSPTSATACGLRRSPTNWSARFPTREDGRYYQAAAAFLAGRATDVERPIRALLSCESAPRERTEPARRCVRVTWKTRVCPGGVRRRAGTGSSRPVRVRESRLLASRARRPGRRPPGSSAKRWRSTPPPRRPDADSRSSRQSSQ